MWEAAPAGDLLLGKGEQRMLPGGHGRAGLTVLLLAASQSHGQTENTVVTSFHTGGHTVYHLRCAHSQGHTAPLLVGAAYDGAVLCCTTDGRRLWANADSTAFPFDLAVFDIDGDGKQEVLGAGWDRKRERRHKYNYSADQIVAFAREREQAGEAFALWAGHGNDPFYMQLATIRRILDAAPTTLVALVFPEMTSTNEAMAYAVERHIIPVAELCRKHGRAKVTVGTAASMRACARGHDRRLFGKRRGRAAGGGGHAVAVRGRVKPSAGALGTVVLSR